MRSLLLALLGPLLLLLAGCEARPAGAPAVPVNQLTQVGLINALMLGEYDGVMMLREVLQYGDQGLGTLDHLDGEMIILDGRAYQARSDGAVVEISPQITTPFAIVTRFKKAGELPCTNVGSLEELESHLDAALPNQNAFLALRVDADFDSITIRSVARQEPPYQPLAEVTKQQAIWTHDNVRGTLVGFRCPEWIQKLNVPGYHWHFLSDDRKIGGHVLECRVRGGTAAYAVCDSWLVKLPESLDAHGKDLNADLSREVKQVERLRGEKPKQPELVPSR